MAKVLIYSANVELAKELLTAGRLLGDTTALALGAEDAKVLSDAGAPVLLAADPAISPSDTAAVAQVVGLAAEQCGATVVLLSSDRRGKELAGRLAAVIDAGCLTDVKSLLVEGSDIKCTRISYGGATLATETIISEKKVIAISSASFEKAEPQSGGSVSDLSASVSATVRLLGSNPKAEDSVDITAADVIVAIGQGVEQEDVASAEALAKALNGVLACSKPVATDRHYLSEERIIGLSGALCKPNLAILVGISGQVQFSVGIRDAKTIISVNTDENADMIGMSDYYYVKDAKEALTELNSRLA
jgi:electron transfer flavoprotein alpha subunit